MLLKIYISSDNINLDFYEFNTAIIFINVTQLTFIPMDISLIFHGKALKVCIPVW